MWINAGDSNREKITSCFFKYMASTSSPYNISEFFFAANRPVIKRALAVIRVGTKKQNNNLFPFTVCKKIF